MTWYRGKVWSINVRLLKDSESYVEEEDAEQEEETENSNSLVAVVN